MTLQDDRPIFSTKRKSIGKWIIIIASYFFLFLIDGPLLIKLTLPLTWVYLFSLWELKYAVFYQDNIEFKYPFNPFKENKKINYQDISKVLIAPMPLNDDRSFRIYFVQGNKKYKARFYILNPKMYQDLIDIMKERHVKIFLITQWLPYEKNAL
jgi:hypothetical protein